MGREVVLASLSLIIQSDAKKTDAEKAEEADAEILTAIAARRKLASDLELAQGVHYTEPMKTSCVLSMGLGAIPPYIPTTFT